MKIKWLWFVMFAIPGMLMIAGGLLVPAHLRAVDAGVIQRAGWDDPSLLEQGRALAAARHLGAALLLAEAARAAGISGWDRLAESVTNLARQAPSDLAWGGDAWLQKQFAINPDPLAPISEPLTTFLIRQKNRDQALGSLRSSKVPAVQQLLWCRELETTVIFPPSTSASGQAFDIAVAECGLLLDRGCLATGLGNDIAIFAATVDRGRGSEPLEQILMDILSLGQRFNWDQLTGFVARIPDAAALHHLTSVARNAGGHLPVLFAAVQLTGRPTEVANYLIKFRQTGWADLNASLRDGAGGVNELTHSGRRFYSSHLLRRLTLLEPVGDFYYFTANYAFQNPWLALATKWLAYLFGGFFLAMAVHAARPIVSPLEEPLQVRGLHLFRESLFSLGFLLVVLLLSEPFLAQESQKGDSSLRPHLPVVGGVVPAENASLKSKTIMNPTILLILLLFFVLQALLYLACLIKLAEIRRQAVPPRMKLKLLENEDHLFDAGLYLGFVGTIVSLILASLGLVKFSLMAAYSSTSFGIIFVVLFKIFHLRPARRKLLLEADAAEVPVATEPVVPAPEPSPT